MSETSVHSDDLSQNGAEFGGAGSSQVNPKVLGAALVALATLSGGLWLFFGTAWAAFCGGIFVGSLLGLVELVTKKDGWARNIVQPLVFMLMLVLHSYKGNILMPQTWEPGAYNNGLGVLGLFTMIVASAWLGGGARSVEPSPGGAKKSADAKERADSVVEEQRQEAAVQPHSIGWPSLVALLAIITCIVLAVSSAFPRLIGTPDQAIARYLISNVYGFGPLGGVTKQNLGAVLANQISVVSKVVAIEGNMATAKLSLSVPLVPFEIDERALNSFQAERKWLDLSDSQRGTSVIVDGVIHMSRSGLWGWSVDSVDLKSDLVAVQQMAKNGTARMVQQADPFRGAMGALFGLLVGMSMAMAMAVPVIGLLLLFVKGDRACAIVCAGAIASCAAVSFPVFFVFTSIGVVQ